MEESIAIGFATALAHGVKLFVYEGYLGDSGIAGTIAIPGHAEGPWVPHFVGLMAAII